MNKYVNQRLAELQHERSALQESEQQLTEALEQVRNRIAMISGGIQELNLIQQGDWPEDSSDQPIPQGQPSPSRQS